MAEPIKVSYLVDEIAHFNWLTHINSMYSIVCTAPLNESCPYEDASFVNCV